MILAGDLGATNCRLAVFDDTLTLVVQRNYKCINYDRFDDIVACFIKDLNYPVRKACFAIPGPIRGGQCRLTDLPSWPVVDERDLRRLLKMPVALLNDAQSHALGLETVREDELITLLSGEKDPKGTRAMLPLGTGIGESALIDVEGWIHAIPTEGGNADFGPKNELEIALMRHIQREYRQVSYEMVLGGPGLIRIYQFLLDYRKERIPSWLEARMQRGDHAAVISEAGSAGECSVCEKALEMFTSILAAEAGNVALKFFATGGVYIGGGITPKIIEKLRAPLFGAHFVRKDRLESFLRTIPVYAVLTSNTALCGAAWYATHRMCYSTGGHG